MVFKVKGKVITPEEMQIKRIAKEKAKAKSMPVESTEATEVYKPAPKKAKKSKSITKKKTSL